MLTTALIALPLAASAPASPQDGADDRTPPPPISVVTGRPRFAAPQALTTPSGEHLGRGRMYPSPRLLDVDGDGQPELVVGDLPGKVTVSERSKDDGPLVWTAPEPLVTDGRELKFNNW